MAKLGGVVAAVALVAVASLAGCSGGTGDASGSDAGRATTTAARERSWGSPPVTTVPPDPIPWAEVVELAATPTGRLVRTSEAVWPNGDNRVGGTDAVTESTTFDRTRNVAVTDAAMPGPDGEVSEAELVVSDDGLLLSADWVEGRCGAPWVAVPPERRPADLFPLGPLAGLDKVVVPEPGRSTETSTTYEVALPALFVPGAAFLEEHPSFLEALRGQMTFAEVTVDADGTLTIVQQLPFSLIIGAGADLGELGRIAPTAALQATWRLEAADEPVDLQVPTDVAADPACAE